MFDKNSTGLLYVIFLLIENNPTRRDWLVSSIAAAAWPQVLAARQHAHQSVAMAKPALETFDLDFASEVEALTAQIIPSAGGPGAREAGAVFFIDRALATFAQNHRQDYTTGMADLQQQRQQLFPLSKNIASLEDQQQIALIKAMETTPFFELLRTHTVLGFLADPSYGGNRDGAGWRHIGFEDRMAWEHPFGYYEAPSQTPA